MTVQSSSPRANLIRGAAWTVATRWVIKGLGFINTVVMARILVPADYGVVAMAMLVVGLIQTFLDFGATVALLRKGELEQADIDSAWTLRAIQGLAAALVLCICAPIAEQVLGEDRLQAVLWVMALCVGLAGLQSIGPTLAHKEFNFALGFKIETSAKVASVVTTIALGAWLRNHWALVGGIAMGYLIPLVMGYALHPYRPRFDRSRIGDIWGVTKWLLVSQIGAFILRKGDELAAARLGDTRGYGLYNVGSDFGGMPVSEVGPAMLRALLPVLSSIHKEVDRIRLAVVKTTATVNGVIWPISFGFAAVSAQATYLVFGDAWKDAAPYVAIFALVQAFLNSTSALRTLLTLQAHTKVQSKIVWGEFLVFAAVAALLFPQYGLLGLAYARLVAAITNMLTTLWVSIQLSDMTPGDLAKAIFRPMFCAFTMFWIVHALQSWSISVALLILLSILIGAVSYVLLSVITWNLVGRPEGVEKLALDLWAGRRERSVSA